MPLTTVEQYLCDKQNGLAGKKAGAECGRIVKGKKGVRMTLTIAPADGSNPGSVAELRFHSNSCANFWLRRVRVADGPEDDEAPEAEVVQDLAEVGAGANGSGR